MPSPASAKPHKDVNLYRFESPHPETDRPAEARILRQSTVQALHCAGYQGAAYAAPLLYSRARLATMSLSSTDSITLSQSIAPSIVTPQHCSPWY